MPASETMDDQLPKHSCIGIIVLATAFLVYFSLGFLVSEAAHASSTPAESDHFCAFDDLEAWERDHLHPASKRPANLNVGEPRTVRMIYFLPNDWPYRADVVDSMKTAIKQVQTFFDDQMQAHGYGDRTLRIETDSHGEPMVHRLDAPHPYNHYVSSTSTVGTIVREIDRTFDLDANIYLIFNVGASRAGCPRSQDIRIRDERPNRQSTQLSLSVYLLAARLRCWGFFRAIPSANNARDGLFR